METFRNFASDLVSGGLSGIVAKTVAAPVERVKLLLQTQKVNTDLARSYDGPIDCIRRVYREQGIVSFWRGNMANVIRYFPNQALNFAFKDRYKEIFVGPNGNDKNNFWRMFVGSLAAGGAAGATSLLVTYPLDVARTRLATDVSQKGGARRFGGTADCLRRIYAENGVQGLYAGYAVSLSGVVVFKALFLGGYDIAKSVLELDQGSHVSTRLAAAQVSKLA